MAARGAGGGVVLGAAGADGIAGGMGSSSGPAWAQAPRGSAEESRIAVRARGARKLISGMWGHSTKGLTP